MCSVILLAAWWHLHQLNNLQRNGGINAAVIFCYVATYILHINGMWRVTAALCAHSLQILFILTHISAHVIGPVAITVISAQQVIIYNHAVLITLQTLTLD